MLTHRAHVAVVRIGGELIAAISAFPQIADEGVSIDTVARADVMTDDQFGFGVHCQPDHRAAPLFGIAFVQVRLPRVDEAPHLIELHKSRLDVLHFGIEKLAGFLRCGQHQRKNRVLVQPGKPGDRANAHTLKHERDNACGSLRVGVVRARAWE